MSALEQILAQGTQIRANETQAIKEGQQQLADTGAIARDAITRSADAQIEIAKITQAEDESKLAARQDIAKQLGVTAGDAQRALLSRDILQAKDQLLNAHAEMSAITEQKFTDNPLGWLINQFRQPFVEEQVKEAESKFNDLSGTYAKLDTIAQNGFQTVNQINQADATARFAANAKLIYATADGQAAQLKRQEVQDGLTAARQIGDIALGDNAQAFNILQYKQQRADHDQAMRMQQEHLRMAQEAAADRKKANAAIEERETLLKAGLASFYPTQAERDNVMKYSSAQLEAALKQNPVITDQAYAAGLRIVTNGGKLPPVVSYGTTVGEAANVMDMTRSPPPNAQWLMDIRKEFALKSPEAQKQLGVAGGDIVYELAKGANGKPIQISPAFDKAVETRLLERAKNINPKDGTNPFIAPSLSQLVRVDPQVAQLGIVKNYLGNLGAGAEESLKDPKAIILGVMAAQPNTDPLALAKEVSTLYDRVRAHTNSVNNFIGLGVTPKVLEAGYKVDGIDYAKPAEVTKFLMKLEFKKAGFSFEPLN